MVKLIKKKFKTPKSRQQAVNKLCNQLRRIKNDLLNGDKPKTSSTIYHSWIDKERKNILPNRKYKKDNVYYDLLCSPQEYLPFMFYMMKRVESYNESVNNGTANVRFAGTDYSTNNNVVDAIKSACDL